MKGATTAAAGSAGLVPVPAKGSNLTFLRGDGIWADPVLTGVGNVRYNESTDTVQIYNGSTWIDWKNGNLTNTYIIKNGILDLDIASNIEIYPAYSNNSGAVRTNTDTSDYSVTSDSSSIILNHYNVAQQGGYGVTGFFGKQIDLTDYNYLEMDFSIVHTGYNQSGTASSALVISSINSGTPYTTAGYKMILGPITESNSGTVSINVSALSGYYYIGVELGLRPTSTGKYTECKIFNMWLS